MNNFFDVDESDVIDDEGNVISYAEVIRYFGISPVIERFGTWVVSTYGLECLTMDYPIKLNRVEELDWVLHMSEKGWVKMYDFVRALGYAQQLLKRRKNMLNLGESLKVFLCHGIEDKPSVRLLYNKLLAEGLTPWLDEEDLLPGQDWRFEISKAVRDSDVVLVCLSTNSVSKKGFINKEIAFALDAADYRPQGQIFLIPVRLDACEVPDRLSTWQWVDLFREDGYGRLITALHHMQSSNKK